VLFSITFRNVSDLTCNTVPLTSADHPHAGADAHENPAICRVEISRFFHSLHCLIAKVWKAWKKMCMDCIVKAIVMAPQGHSSYHYIRGMADNCEQN
jgi:hypothetical protein